MTSIEPAPLEAAPNEYAVRVDDGELGWEVRILAPAGAVAWTRSCGSEEEARTLEPALSKYLASGEKTEHQDIVEYVQKTLHDALNDGDTASTTAKQRGRSGADVDAFER